MFQFYYKYVKPGESLMEFSCRFPSSHKSIFSVVSLCKSKSWSMQRGSERSGETATRLVPIKAFICERCVAGRR